MKKINIVIILLIACFNLNISRLTADIQTNGSYVAAISEININSLKYIDTDWSANTMRDYLRLHMQHRLYPTQCSKRRVGFEFFKALEKAQQFVPTSIIDDTTTLHDLNLLCGQSDRAQYVVNAVNHTQTDIGFMSLMLTLINPVIDTTVIKKRQEIVKYLSGNKEVLETLTGLFGELAQAENIMCSFWDKLHFNHSVNQQAMLDVPGFDWLNDSEEYLLLHSTTFHGLRGWQVIMQVLASASLLTYGVSVAVYGDQVSNKLRNWAQEYKGCAGAIFPPLFNLITNRWLHSLLAVAGGAFCGLTIKRSYNWFQDMHMLEESVHTLMNHVAKYLNGVRAIYEEIKKHPKLYNFDEFKSIRDFFEKSCDEQDGLVEFFELLESGTFQKEPGVLRHKGVILKGFRCLHKLKQKLEGVLAAAGNVEAFCSMATWFNNHQQGKARVSFANFATNDKPQLEINNFWHPLIDEKKVITNSISLGAGDNRSNAIITGPNAGGKSIVLKTAALCIIFGQSFGIVPAASMTFTPFAKIATYLNIIDDVGAGNSLYKAEVQRAQKLFDEIQQAQPGEFVFAIFDEIFNGTNPTEGAAGAYAVAKGLGLFDQSLCMIATHFDVLTKLEQETQSFANYKVSVVEHGDGTISYPYNLESGISNQHVALKILRNEGFSGELVDEAERLVGEAHKE